MGVFHYKVMKPMIPNIKVCYTDTDSLVYEIPLSDEDYYKVCDLKRKWFDNADFPEKHPYFNKTYKKIPGRFKDELAGRMIEEFIGLGPKMYCMTEIVDGKEKYKVTGKGINKVILKQLQGKNFRNVLFRKDFDNVERENTRLFTCIQSKNHVLRTVMTGKVTLSASDNKRYILSDGIHSLAYGHCYIDKLERGQITEEEVLVKLGYTDRYITNDSLIVFKECVDMLEKGEMTEEELLAKLGF